MSKSIAEVVREIISTRPFLEDALARNIVNYNNLANELLPEIVSITKISKEKLKLTSIAMALRRLGEKYQSNYDGRIEEKLKQFVGTDMTIKYDLVEITIALRNQKNVSDIIKGLYGFLEAGKDDFLSITKGSAELTIITQERYKGKILSFCSKKVLEVKHQTLELAALSISIPTDSQLTPGLFYLFSKVLLLKGVNIVELVSTFSEMQFILDENDVGSASNAIRKLLKNTAPFE